MYRFVCLTLAALWLSGVDASKLPAQAPQAIDAELQRLQGDWRVTELVESGQTISQAQMRSLLPGGGLVEIIDNTLLFKSPVDGHKSTKSFRMDSSSYPKRIAIFDKDRMTGQGIFQHDGSRLVICVAPPPNPAPTDFSAPAGSNRMMMVLEPFSETSVGAKPLELGPPPTVAFSAPAASAVPTAAANPAAFSAQQAAPVPTPVASAARPASAVATPADQTPAGRVLTDVEVKQMLVGTWRLNDGSGLIDIAVDGRGTFNSYRHAQQTQMFNQVFVPTPVSSGTWSVQNGQMFLKVVSSWRAEVVNTTMVFAVRSISPKDAILIDTLGRLSRAERLP